MNHDEAVRVLKNTRALLVFEGEIAQALDYAIAQLERNAYRGAYWRGDAPQNKKLWLWKNFVDGRPEYWAFDNPHPREIGGGDPLTLGEPCGYALLKPSDTNHQDFDEAEVLHRIKIAQERLDRPANAGEPINHSGDSTNAVTQFDERIEKLRKQYGFPFEPMPYRMMISYIASRLNVAEMLALIGEMHAHIVQLKGRHEKG